MTHALQGESVYSSYMKLQTARALWTALLLAGSFARAAVVEVSLGGVPIAPGLSASAGVQNTLSVTPLAAVSASVPVLPASILSAASPLAIVASGAAPVSIAARSQSVAVAARAIVPNHFLSAASENDTSDAKILFDGAASRRELTPAQALATQFPGVTFQNEQEGNLLQGDAKDSDGTVFAYYRPTDLRLDLLSQAAARMDGFDRFGMSVKTLRGLLTRGNALKTWNALPKTGKMYYLALLSEAVSSEKGADAVWKGKRFLLLEKSPDAPDFVAEHPDMEDPPSALRESLGARFLQPEIVSHKERAARTASEAIARTRRVIADTGHAGTQYHAFVTMPTDALLAAMPRLTAALQAFNDLLFLEAAIESPDNLLHGSLKPWHAGRSERARTLVAGGSADAHQPKSDDADSEKHAFVGFRYWGTKDGQATVSLELRGTSLPWKRQGAAATRGIEGASMPEAKRDYSQLERALGEIALIADRLRNGGLPTVTDAAVSLDAEAVARALSARSAAHGAPPVSVADLVALSGALGGGPGIHPALLYPLARGGADAYASELWKQALALRAQGADQFNARLARGSTPWPAEAASQRALRACARGWACPRRHCRYRRSRRARYSAGSSSRTARHRPRPISRGAVPACAS